MLDCLAVTDHNSADAALALQQRFGQKIIVGEEIDTLQGEIIGLFLKQAVSPGKSLPETILAIREQGGLVYIPHPLEKFRRGLSQAVLEQYRSQFDIIEVFNARGWGRGRPSQALRFAKENNLACASASDAHSVSGLGTAFVEISEWPTPQNLVEQMRVGKITAKYAPALSYLAPSVNRVRKYFTKSNA